MVLLLHLVWIYFADTSGTIACHRNYDKELVCDQPTSIGITDKNDPLFKTLSICCPVIETTHPVSGCNNLQLASDPVALDRTRCHNCMSVLYTFPVRGQDRDRHLSGVVLAAHMFSVILFP